MAHLNPGLAPRLRAAVQTVQAAEVAAGNPQPLGHWKSLISGGLLAVIDWLMRDDQTNALDYDDQQRTNEENFLKSKTVLLLAFYLWLLAQEPVRAWPEIDVLGDCLADLTTTEDTSWPAEIITLAQHRGLTVDRKRTVSGVASFTTPEGTITASVYKARQPDEPLNGCYVYLVERLAASGELTGEYVLMVDDAYWGRRIQPAAFQAAPFSEDFVMGYRLQGQILHDGQPQEGANVSLEVALGTHTDGLVRFWDSEEYNELVYSVEKDTYVSGSTVLAPIRTQADGSWNFIVPQGHGGIYQRPGDYRDDTAETAAEPLPRWVEQIYVAYRGRKAAVAEGEPAVIDILSGMLNIYATAGAYLRVGTLDDAGQNYLVPPSGLVEITGLPTGEHSIVQYRRSGGDWDPDWGCPRVIAEVQAGQTTNVTMPPLEYYGPTGGIVCGRVYQRMGIPAPGIDIVVVDTEVGEIVGVIATTNEEGFWSAAVPPGGLGGQLYILDSAWGSLRVLGNPYSDVVLGARAYTASIEEFKPEAWRTGTYGHNNFQYVDAAVWVEDNDTGQTYPTTQAPYGGWMTIDTAPKYAYISDLIQLILYGPQLKSYALYADGEAIDPDFKLRSQSFEEAPTLPGQFRAAGYYPERKFLLGGKIKANVVIGSADRLDEDQPEAARVGLEFGKLQPYLELRQRAKHSTAVTELLCPYCGGPAQRDPGQTVPRGFCLQCAAAFGLPSAMDARSYSRSVTLPARPDYRYGHRAVAITTNSGFQRPVDYHWRPDLYDETDYFLIQSGPGQPTNAPRWFAKHLNEVSDGKGLGQFDGDQSPSYISGHDLEYFGNLPYIGRDLGLAQFKLGFEADYQVPLELTVEIDCVRTDDAIETIAVTIPQGTSGPNDLHPFGDVIPVRSVPKLAAERKDEPYEGCGLYKAVADIRLVDAEEALGCRFTVIADVPFLAHPQGVVVESKKASPVALQLIPPAGHPHIFEDGVGQLFLFDVADANIRMRRRAGLLADWELPRWVTSDGQSDYPWASKDSRGRIILARQFGTSQVRLMQSADDGHTWEEL